MSKPIFYYPVSININGAVVRRIAPLVFSLPLEPVDPVVILPLDVGSYPQGMYVANGSSWQFALPYADLCSASIFSSDLTVYADPDSPSTAPSGSTVYKNGVLQGGQSIAAEHAVYIVLTPQEGGYTLRPATSSGLGGVIVPPSSVIVVDAAGNITLKPSFVSAVNNSLSSITSGGAGTSLVQGVSAPNAVLKSLVASGALTLADQGDTITLGVPVATASVPGAVKVGTGLTVAGDGTLSALVSAITLQGDVTGTGTGTITAVLSNSGVSAGTYNTVTVDAKGRVTEGANAAYLTSNQNITVSGDASGVGSTSIALTLADSGVSAGSYGSAAQTLTFTVDAKGRLTAVDSVPIELPFSAVTDKPSTVAGYGITDALTANQNITVSGDASGTGSTAITLTLASSGVSAGTYKSVTVDAKGRVTSGTNPTTLAGFGITDGLRKTGDSVTGNLIFIGGSTVTGLPTPAVNGDAANKVYVDNAVAAVAAGVYWKANADVASTGNLTLSGLQIIDGFSTSVGNRVLVKNQTDQKENGVYIVGSGAWSRASDTDSGSEIRGMAILVINGTTNPLTQWVNTNFVDPTIGTDPITYALLSAPTTTYVAGTGLTLTGNQFSITNTGVSAGTYTKVTVNAQGQVTAGSALNASDVSTALGYTAYNGVANPQGFLTSNQNVTLSGDASGTGSTAIAVTLAASGVTAGTYTKVTVDAKGRVTVGADLASSDITTALGYAPYNGTTNPQGFLTANQPITVSGDAAGSGTTSLVLTLANSGATAGTYTKVTVDAKGRVTTGTSLNASDVNTALGYTAYDGEANLNGFLTGNQAITFTGDATGSGATSVALTLANSGVTAGAYTKVTVDAKGRVTAGTNPTTLAGFGISDALPLTGGSMTGPLTMTGGATVTGLPAPSASSDAVPKNYVDTAVAGSGRLSKSVTGGTDVTLTATEAANLFYEFTGTLTANINVIVPTNARQFFVRNATSGAFTLTVRTSAGNGVAVLQGTRAHLECDGTDVLAPTSIDATLFVTAANNVGVNTTNPSYSLDVNGIAVGVGTKTALSGAGGNIRHRDDTGTVRYAAGILGTAGATAYDVFDVIANTSRFTIDTNGNVGIGISTPTQTLDVRGVNGGNITAGRTANAGASSEPGNYYVTAPNASGASRVWMSLRTIVTTPTNGSEAAVLAFNNQVAGALREGMRLNELGNVLIGKTAATLGTRLEVSGNFSAGRTNMPVYIKDNAGTDFGNDIYLPFDGGSSTQKAFRIRSSYNGGSTASKLSISHATNTIAQNADPSTLTYVEDVIVNNAGQVLIGAGGSINGARLTVIGPAANSGAVACLRNSDTTGAGAWVAQDDTATKYCEIGVLNSATTLTADYGTAGEGYLRSSANAAGLHIVCANPSGYTRFSIAGAEKVRLDNNGNVLIGITSALARLHVKGAYGSGSNTARFESANATQSLDVLAGYALTNGTAAGVQADTVMTLRSSGSTPGAIAFASGNTEFMRLVSSGNLGIGNTAPSAKLDVGGISTSSPQAILTRGASDNNFRLVARNGSGSAVNTIQATFGMEYWGSGTAAGLGFLRGNTFLDSSLLLYTNNAEQARLDSSGNLLVGVTSGSTHILSKGSTEGTQVLSVANSVGAYVVADFTYNSGAAALKVGKHTTSSRSINAAGTINASGADYAEYMTKADTCGTVAPGQVVGIDASGKITDKWAEAVSFMIKSTNPSYVGGDTWGAEEKLGMECPVTPVFEAPAYTGPETPPGDATEAELATYEAAQTSYQAEVTAARDQFDKVTMPAYRLAVAEFEALLEAARQKVDRIAFCGQVPVNVYRAQPGQYVVPYMTASGGIGGLLVDDRTITFEQYRRSVGVVQNILPDGRANVRVKPV